MDEKTYEERLEEARRPNREWSREQKRKGSIRQINNALRAYVFKYGQRLDLSNYERQRQARIETNGCGVPSLPSVSILETPTDVTEDDFRVGVRALREAGL